MTTISLDISGKIDPGTVEVFAAVSHVMTELKMPYIVVGAAACLLGQRARDIANKNTVAVIEALVNEEPGKLNFDLLAEEMCSHIENEFDRKLQLLSAFLDGFNYKD